MRISREEWAWNRSTARDKKQWNIAFLLQMKVNEFSLEAKPFAAGDVHLKFIKPCPCTHFPRASHSITPASVSSEFQICFHSSCVFWLSSLSLPLELQTTMEPQSSPQPSRASNKMYWDHTETCSKFRTTQRPLTLHIHLSRSLMSASQTQELLSTTLNPSLMVKNFNCVKISRGNLILIYIV